MDYVIAGILFVGLGLIFNELVRIRLLLQHKAHRSRAVKLNGTFSKEINREDAFPREGA